MTWTKELDDVVEENHLLNHPFYVAWSRGELSKETLQAYAAQYYRHVAAFPRYISQIHARTESLPARQYLLENLIDEERGEESHPELWLRFAEGIGIGRDEVRAADALPETTACDQVFRRVTETASPRAALAALYAYESMVPPVSVSKIEGLREFYGVDDNETLRFFDVHIEVDERHASVARELLEDATADERDEAIAAARDALGALNTLLDGVLRAHCPEVAA